VRNLHKRKRSMRVLHQWHKARLRISPTIIW